MKGRNKMKKILSVFLAAVMLFSVMMVWASANNETATRTTTLNLNAAEFVSDTANEAEGWSWNAETLTLTLDSVNFETGEEDAVELVKNATTNINMVGESNISTTGNGLAFSRGWYEGAVCFKGDGVINVTYDGKAGSMDVGSFTLESGTLNIKGGAVFVLNSVTINGGTLNVDTVGCISSNGGGFDGFQILGDGVDINGGTVNIKAERAPFFIVGNSTYDMIAADKGLVIKGGDVTLYGKLCASWIGYIQTREAVIETTGTVTIKGGESGIGLYCANGIFDIRKGIINNPDNLAADMLFRDPDGTAQIAPADYSAVDAAIAKIPEKLSDYTDESVAAIQAAVDAVDRELSVLDQVKVNGYAEAIEAAVEAIEEETFFGKLEKFFGNLFGGESDGECWLIRIFKAIINFFVNIFNTVFGWIAK